MKVILLYVASVDGKLTKWGQPHVHEWSSKEDAAHFFDTLKKNNLIVMGSNTFTAVNPQPEKGTLRIVLTRTPLKYKKFTVPGQLEFSNEPPEELVHRLKNQNYKQLLLVSGKTLSTEFLKKKLVTELWLTIEPKLFGSGDPLIANEKLDITLQLLSTKKLNSQGTLLLKYKIQK